MPAPSSSEHETALRWDIFCRVIDNLGDIGVCWRLAVNLARQGQRVRLWIDQPAPLAWMAPQGHPGVTVQPWNEPFEATALQPPPGDVWIEAFGCELPAAFVAARQRDPVWLNLEYLSAEDWVERHHRLPSPVLHGPGAGLTKWFFYPGFTAGTGGLLREPEATAPDPQADARWLQGLQLPLRPDARRVLLFCYEPASLAPVMAQARQIDWLVTPGRAEAASRDLPLPPDSRRHRLPAVPQPDFDRLLRSADLNFVRGEDSLVRALWAGRPFVWHIYPQHDDAHHAKLLAFLDWLQAPASLRAFHLHWNGLTPAGADGLWPDGATLAEWQNTVLAARDRLLAQTDLVGQLRAFVGERRPGGPDTEKH